MTWCYGKVIIREGADGGWYHNKDTAGRTIYEGQMDWDRHKQALIRSSAVSMLRRGRKLIDEFPEIADIIAEKIKDQDKFKLNSEFAEDETSNN